MARSAAIAAMVLYHFVFDLDMFGLIAPGTALTGGWRLLALATASSFLFLAGISLWLAHGAGIRWPKFWRRFGMIAAAAVVVTVASFFAIREAFIFFGILHAIALSSLIGIALLRLPITLLVAMAGLAIWAPTALRATVFDAQALWWVGLSTFQIPTADYIPILPWIGPFLLGMALAKALSHWRAWPTRSATRPSGVLRALSWPGQHSLAIYLLHQPVLIALIWLSLTFFTA